MSERHIGDSGPPASEPAIGTSTNGETTDGSAPNGPGTHARLGYIPALDGVRALAVAAVLVYHGDLGWFSGGFLGVDVFFVLSGYLITSVLLGAWRRNGGSLGLGRFYLHRARRLLPALLVMITVTCAYVVVFLPNEASKLRGGVVASFGYVTNWYLIFHHQSYFSSIGRPPMLQHLWSLAIEEQFYLLWPLLLGLALRFWRPSRVKLAVTILAVAGASAVLMALLYRAGGDPSRVYYGTDTHSSGLLIGAGMAVLLPPWQLRGRLGRRAPMALDAIGLAGVLVLLWCFVNVSEFDSSLYRGGYLVFACVAAAVILVAVHPATTVTAGLLGTSPMVWIGKRSYGIYLWHWPVFLVTRPGLDVPLTGIPLFVLRVGITVGLAAASYRFVEVPIRSGALSRRLAALKQALWQSSMLQRRRVRKRFGFAAVAVIVTTAVLGIGLAVAQPAPRPPGFPAKPANIAITTTTRTPHASSPTSAAPAPPAPAPAHSAPSTTLLPIPNARVTAIGDSVMLGAQSSLQRYLGDRIQMDANVSRHFGEGLDVIRQLHDAGQLGDEVVVHLGTNGSVPEDQLDEMMRLLTGVKRVVLVNTRVDRPWEQPDNDAIAAAVSRYPNAVLFDWYTAASQHPELLVEDGVHLSTAGQAYYSLVLASKL
ncbi:MAG TPA: acyltransferase family protein [Acidimicrobiia bacterium]